MPKLNVVRLRSQGAQLHLGLLGPVLSCPKAFVREPHDVRFRRNANEDATAEFARHSARLFVSQVLVMCCTVLAGFMIKGKASAPAAGTGL